MTSSSEPTWVPDIDRTGKENPPATEEEITADGRRVGAAPSRCLRRERTGLGSPRELVAVHVEGGRLVIHPVVRQVGILGAYLRVVGWPRA
ncbi:hypothetical protein GCM10012278_51830 [Nonomuraea glycinis]|uniref:Uncharacterized protein n=1 Tax=Nonomuraea glycinis TaxID=2047744 RepID=A0A918A7Q6_9ACTN|nr:hypothetical protein GCM10012278_51830 [Nonomuraea glycinis]